MIKYILQKYNFQAYGHVTLIAILAAISSFQKKKRCVLFVSYVEVRLKLQSAVYG